MIANEERAASPFTQGHELPRRIDIEGAHPNALDSEDSSIARVGEKIEEGENLQVTIEKDDVRSIRGWKWIAVCLSVYSSCYLYGLDTTIVADIQGNAAETFGAVEKLAWLTTGFSLGSISIIMSLGKAFGVFNLKSLFFSFLVLFEAGSALCGAAPNMNALICGQILTGVGGAGIYLGSLNVIATFTPKNQRPIYIGAIAFCWGVGCISGPIIGGAFADSAATWRWAFYINLVLFGLFLPVYFFIPSFDPQPDKSLRSKLLQMDWIGATLNAAVYTMFVIALTFGGATWRSQAGGTTGAFFAFGVLVITFGIQQKFAIFTTKEYRIFPVDFLSNPTLVLLYALTACNATSLCISIYYTPLYFQFVHGVDGIDSAVKLLPFLFLFLFFVMLNGFVMPMTGWYMPWFLFSNIFITLGTGLMYGLLDRKTSDGAIYGFSVIIAIGTGATCQAAYSVAPAKVSPARMADAVGFINSAQIGSMTISLAISGTIFQNIAYQHIEEAVEGLGFSPADIHAAIAGVRSSILSTTSPEVRIAVIEGIINAIRDIWIMVIAAGSLGVLLSLFLKRERLYMELTAGG